MKTEMNKEKEEIKKREKGKWTEAAQYRNITARQTFPNCYFPLSLSLFSDVWDPHIISLLSPSTRALPPLMPPVTPRPFLLLSLSLDALPTKPPSPSPFPPPQISTQIAPRPPKFLAGGAPICYGKTPIPAERGDSSVPP
jgi:hypothetical protein